MHSDFHIGKWAGMSGAFGAIAMAQWMDAPVFPMWVLAIMAVAAGAVPCGRSSDLTRHLPRPQHRCVPER